MKRKPEAPKPRNPYMAHALFKRAGAHGKTKKAERRIAKMSLRQEHAPVA